MNENEASVLTEETDVATELGEEEEALQEESALQEITEEGESEEDGAEEELASLKRSFSELSDVATLTELPTRYKELRSLGLTPEEAYLASAKRRPRDTRSHLTDSFPRPTSAPTSSMTRRELCAARELFKGMGDAEIIRLYKRVCG